MSYGLTNRMMVRKDKPGEPQAGAPRELLNVSLRQSYYTDAQRQPVRHRTIRTATATARANAFSPIALVARATPIDAAGDRLPARVRPEGAAGQSEAARHEPERHAANAGRERHRRLDPAGVRTTTPTGVVTNANNYVQTASDFRLQAKPVRRQRHVQLRHRRNTLVNQRYVGFYNAQCCGVPFEYQAYNYPEQSDQFLLPQDRRFNMSFTLAGVGTFSNFFGAFGGVGTY